MTKTFPEVISGIRTAKKGVEVREDIAQMGEYVEQFASTATTKAREAEESAEQAKNAVDGIDQQKADSVAAVQQAQTTATVAITQTKDTALNDIGDAKTAALRDVESSTEAAQTAAAEAKASEQATEKSKEAAATSASTATTKASEASTSAVAASTSRQAAEKAQKAAEDAAALAGTRAGTDKTLSIENAPADAKTVGDKFKSIKTDWNSVTDKPSTFPSTWDSVSGKPNVYPTNWDNVSGKPSNYPPSEHNHSAANITSGILGLARGGTGCSTALDACKTLLWRGHTYVETNWDDLDTGIWRTSPAKWGTNGPSGVYKFGIVMVWNYDGNVTQVYIAHSKGEMAFRQRYMTGSVFTAWARVNTNTITSQTSDPGAGSSLETGSILLVYA